MAGKIELAKAYVTIVPSMQGSQAAISKEMGAAAGVAGTEAGKTAGANMASSMGASLSSTGKSLTKSVTLPLVAVGAAATKAWKEVDEGLDVIASKTGASGDALEAMGDVLRDITADIPTDFATAGDAIGEVNTRFHATGQELETLSTQFIKFARINNTDVSNSIDTVQKALSAFGKDASEAPALLDALTYASQATGASVDTLAAGLVQNGTAFQELGLDVYQATQFMGELETSGANSETVMQGLRKALKNAAKDGVPLNQALSDLQNAILNGTDSMDGLTAAYDIFGRSGDQIYGAVKNGTIDFQNLATAAADMGGSVSNTFDQVVSPTEKFTQVMNEFKTIGYDLVDSVGPTLADVLGRVADVIKVGADIFEKMPDPMKNVVIYMGLMAAAAGPVMSIGGKLMTGVSALGGKIGSLGNGIGGIAGKLSGLGSAGSSAAGGVSAASSSFSQMGGQALLLVAAGAAVLMIAAGIKILADSAIALAEAGPAAVGVLVLLAGVALGLTAGIVAIGSAATVSAAGLLALGAAVLMVSAGISLIILSLTLFVQQLPIIAEYGATAAGALLQLSAGMAALTVTTAALGVAILTAIVPVGTFTLELLALNGNVLLLNVGFAAMGAVLLVITAEMAAMAASAKSTASDMQTIVNSTNLVSTTLNALKTTASSVMTSVVTAVVSGGGKMLSTATATFPAITALAVTNGAAMTLAWKASLDLMQGETAKAMQKMQKSVEKGVTGIARTFKNTKLEFGRSIALPHFSMSGSFNAQTGSVPSVSVQWYRNAAEQGALFASPRLIGVGDASQPELLIGQNTLYDNIASAVGNTGAGDITIPVYIGQDKLDTIIVKAQQRANYRSGGR